MARRDACAPHVTSATLEPTGVVIWVTGRPSAGKSTFAREARRELVRTGHTCVVLDGDVIRETIVPPHDYSDAGRDAFYATLARLGSVLCEQGVIVLVPATASLSAYRQRARASSPRFLEVFIDTPIEECRRRDAKGLYAGVESGDVTNLPGRGGVYEPPLEPEVVATGGMDRDAIARVLDLVARRTP